MQPIRLILIVCDLSDHFHDPVIEYRGVLDYA